MISFVAHKETINLAMQNWINLVTSLLCDNDLIKRTVSVHVKFYWKRRNAIYKILRFFKILRFKILRYEILDLKFTAKAEQSEFRKQKIPPQPPALLFFCDFIEQISDALDYLHEHDQDHDGICHYIGAEALKAVADRHIAEPAAADRARHRRKSDDDDKRQSNRADDAR